MTLLLTGVTKHSDEVHVFQDEDWVHQVQGDTPLAVTYAHTTRRTPVVIDTLRSKCETERGKNNAKLLASLKNGGFKFLGKELMWSNKLRLTVIADGIHMYIPQVLYLVRPETAFTGCLHYLAQQLGGAEGYIAQRSFIFQNPGITTLMKKFWTKVQEVAWSGGFAPSISEEERALLILALVEAFSITQIRDALTRPTDKAKEGLYLVPHVKAAWLKNAGMYFPSLVDPVRGDAPTTDDEPTADAVKIIADSQKDRQNLPGVPSDIAAYLTCYICSRGFDTPAEAREHKRQNCTGPVNCDACGLSFEHASDYQLHAVTFCRQGPLTQSKCPTCSKPGPRCLCQVHWARTYDLAARLFEGTHGRGEWLTQGTAHLPADTKPMLQDYVVATTLILAKVYHNVPLLPDAQPTTTNSASTPFALNPSLWDLKDVRLPLRDPDQEDVSLKISQEDSVPLLVIAKTLLEGMDLHYLHFEEDPTTPMKSTTKLEGTLRKETVYKYLDTGALKADEFTTKEDLNQLTEKIAATEERLADPDTRELLILSLDLSEDEIGTKLQDLKTLRSAMASALLKRTPLKGLKKSTTHSSTGNNLDMKVPNHGRNQETRHSKENSPTQSQQSSPVQSPTPHRKTFMEDMAHRSREMRRRLDFKDTGNSRDRHKSKSKSPGARTGTSTRGSSWTHTLYLELTRAMSLIQTVDPDPKSTPYKRLRGKVTKSIDRVEKHLNEDEESEIDPAYSEDLEKLLQEAEDLLHEVDVEGDQVEQARQDLKQQNDLISKCLPRTQLQKWDGTINDFMRFKAGAKTLMDNIPDSRMALNAVLDTISDPKLRRSLAKYQTPEEALKSLELQFGNPELSGPKIINDLKGLLRATSTETESAAILNIKELYTSLMEINQQHLLGLDVLYNLCHKLRERHGVELMQKLKTEKDPSELREMFFEQIDDMFTTNTIWSRTDLEKDRRPEEPRREHKDRIKNPERYTDTRRSTTEYGGERLCKICNGNHHNGHCDQVAKMDLNQVKKLQLCPHCLEDKHDEECTRIKWAFVCKQCTFNKNLRKLHTNCNQEINTPEQG